ncbi:hypothetical protein FHU38_001543 [Saccharomonospora amisosensis]|uniref:Uncharacterized protein n=1 Tax=Saccharomonospora amisosensis TaxID=1128677 RepID=A0A7X5ZPX8_9PSEU|nr:hypothetical protein [Saccharomonospora amisosensis]NIJ11199.1 hypothetical protein [Saccharomonospora amisosensis]
MTNGLARAEVMSPLEIEFYRVPAADENFARHALNVSPTPHRPGEATVPDPHRAPPATMPDPAPGQQWRRVHGEPTRETCVRELIVEDGRMAGVRGAPGAEAPTEYRATVIAGPDAVLDLGARRAPDEPLARRRSPPIATDRHRIHSQS